MNNLPELPPITYLDTDPQQTINDIVNRYEMVTGRKLAEADPIRLFLLAEAYLIIQTRLRFEHQLKQQLLYYASGAGLDNLGAFRMTPRLQSSAAVTTLKFTLSAVRPGAVLIPKGTRVTANNILYFATNENVEIKAGSMSVEVDAKALVVGEAGNGIGVGELNIVVDPVPYTPTVENLTITQGGADTEKDDAYRERIYYAPAAFSVAGPADAYKVISESASSTIADVGVFAPQPDNIKDLVQSVLTSNNASDAIKTAVKTALDNAVWPGTVQVRPLLDGGEIPTQTILDLVYEKLSPDTVRPLADYVQVLAPVVKTYDVNYTYYISKSNQATASEIQAAVNNATAQYVAWQRASLDRDINPDELTVLVKAAGAKRLEIVSPVFTKLEPSEVGHAARITVTYGGLENE